MNNYETNQKEETDKEFIKSSQNEISNKPDSNNTPDKSKMKMFSFVKKLKAAGNKNKNDFVDILSKENEKINKIEDNKEEYLSNIDFQDNADEYLKLHTKLFLKNPFSNLEKYIKFGKSDYLLSDMEYYSKNLAEENKKIQNIFPNIFINSDDLHINKKIFDELETDLVSRKLNFQKSLLYEKELNNFDFSSSEFCKELAVKLNKIHKKVKSYQEKLC